eukprot:5857639-Prymnesium_polylepis.1
MACDPQRKGPGPSAEATEKHELRTFLSVRSVGGRARYTSATGTAPKSPIRSPIPKNLASSDSETSTDRQTPNQP